MKIRTYIATTVISGLVACGGGGGGLTVSNGVSTMSGTVIDGLIEKAKVCLDLNGNLICDDGEPYAMSDADGKYSISYTGSVDGLHVIAEVTAESKDKDDNGKTIAEAGKEAFNLAAPAAKPEVVTPLTTLVTHAMVADTTIKSDTAGLKKAEDIVKANTGLTMTMLGNNFVDKNDKDAQNVAKVIAVALGDVAKEVKTSLDSKKQTDSELAKTITTESAQKTIQAQVVKTVSTQIASAVDVDGKLTKSVEISISENKQATGAAVSGQLNNIIVGTKTGASTVSDAKQIFLKGIIIANNENGTLKDGTTRFKDNLQVEYLQGDSVAKTYQNNRRILYTGNSKASWEEKYAWGKEYVLSKNNEWIYSPEIGEKPVNGDIVFDQNCMTFKTDVDKVDADEQVCFTQKDLSGKKIIDILADFCNSDTLKTFPKCNKDAVFKSGSLAYDITFGVTSDRYRNQVNFTWDGYNTTNNLKTVSAFIDATSKDNQWLGNDCNTGFKVKSYNADTKKGIMQWSDASKYTCDNAYKVPFTSVEETAFEVKMVGKIEMLILDISNIFNKNNENDGIGQKFIFNYMSDAAVGRSGIYKGELTLKNTKQQINFNGNVNVGTKETLDSYLDGLGMSTYPYPNSK
jgi:hypothetical protein